MPAIKMPFFTAFLATALVGVSSLSLVHANTIDADAAGSSGPTARRPVDALEEIVVQAQRTTLELARQAQKQAPNLINLTTADEMSRLPDVNTGEAVRRIPGISLETDTGEGRYINIRGLDADFNSTTFGGLRLPPTNNSSPSGAGRAVAFDSIPIGFVGAITVTKSNLPEQDAEALGGTIDITPKTAPLDGRPIADIKIGSGFELLRHTWVTDLAGTAGTRFGGDGGYQPFSVLVTASVYADRRGIDDGEAGFVDGQASGVPDKAIAGYDQRFYKYHRERHGYGIDLGYAPEGGGKYFVRYYDAGYSESVMRNMVQWNFAQNPTVSPTNPNVLIDAVTFDKKLRDEKEYLDSKVFEIGGKNSLSDKTLDYHVGYTNGTYNKPYDYNSTFDSSQANAVAAYDNSTNPNWPTLAIVSPANFNPANPSSYSLTKMSNQSTHSNDHEWGIGANLTAPTQYTDRSNEEFKFGINARIRDKTGDSQQQKLNATSALPLSSALIGSPINFYQGHFQNGPNIDAAVMRAYFAANLANATIDPVDTALNNVHDKENVYAIYGQYQFGFGALGIIAGARVEQTKVTYAGNSQDDSGSLASAGCPILGSIPNAHHVCPVSKDKTYTNFFPTAQARYEFSPDLIGRLAISSTIARPGFQQVTATTVADGSGNVVTGNPNLKPTTATGLDLALERYLPNAGIVSLGFFAKQIKDATVLNAQQTTYQKLGGNLGLALIESFSNAPTAHLYGIEANYVQRFKDLPGALAGLGASVNWTWVQSKLALPVKDPITNLTTLSRDTLMLSTSRNTANAELSYEQSGVNLTLGAYYTSRNIFGFGPSAATDIWTQDRLSVDFGSQFKISEPLSVYFNAKNLTNTALKLTEGQGENRVIQREFYGLTFQAGVNYKFF